MNISLADVAEFYHALEEAGLLGRKNGALQRTKRIAIAKLGSAIRRQRSKMCEECYHGRHVTCSNPTCPCVCKDAIAVPVLAVA